jgi:hypothetical protein
MWGTAQRPFPTERMSFIKHENAPNVKPTPSGAHDPRAAGLSPRLMKRGCRPD